MATLEQKQELIEDIRLPTRYYQIRLWGHGTELVYSKSSKAEYEFWQSQTAANCVGYRPGVDVASPIQIYLWEKDQDPVRFEYIPQQFQREGDWYEQDDLDSVCGVGLHTSCIEITQVSGMQQNASKIKTIVPDQHFYNQFYKNHNCDLLIEHSDVFDYDYVLCGRSEEHGEFFHGIIEVEGRINFAQLQFLAVKHPNDDCLIYGLEYNGERVDTDIAKTVPRSVDQELVKLTNLKTS